VNIQEWALLVRGAAETLPARLEEVVAQVAVIAVESAKDKIGVQQGYWDELRPSTKADKKRLGFSGPYFSPLLRKGELLASIEGAQEGLTATLLSTDEVMFWHEYGTAKMAPRPVIGPSMLEASEIGSDALVSIARTLLG
jgi:hypothetical protein